MEAKIEKELNKKQLLRLEKMFIEADEDGGESKLAMCVHLSPQEIEASVKESPYNMLLNFLL